MAYDTSLNGIINLNKPAGLTSFQAVSRARRILGVRKAGHSGTLDPFATGVLPICVNRATAVVRYMIEQDKRYNVVWRLGRATDTQDLTGETTQIRDSSEEVTAEWLADDGQLLRDKVKSLEGSQIQVPPLYSAVKLNGRPLYSYARAGEQPDLSGKARQITVYRAELQAYWLDPDSDPDAPLCLRVAIHCSKGSYIRTLGETLGERLGTVAYTSELTRTAAGSFAIEESVTLEDLEAGGSDLLLPLETALTLYPVIELSADEAGRLASGQRLLWPAERIPPGDNARDRLYRARGPNGLVGMARFRLDSEGDLILIAERNLSPA